MCRKSIEINQLMIITNKCFVTYINTLLFIVHLLWNSATAINYKEINQQVSIDFAVSPELGVF